MIIKINFQGSFSNQVEQAKRDRQLQRDQGQTPISYLSSQEYGDNDDQDDSSYDPHDRYQKRVEQPRSYQHSHRHNIEKDLPTEAYLFLQKGDKKEAIRVLREVRGMSASAANTLANQFYSLNPQYNQDAVKQQKTKSNISSRMAQEKGSYRTTKKKTTNKNAKEKKGNLVGTLIWIGAILYFIAKFFA